MMFHQAWRRRRRRRGQVKHVVIQLLSAAKR
jgi:hypothetical protein